MRVLHAADWHLGRTPEGGSRLGEQEALLEQHRRNAAGGAAVSPMKRCSRVQRRIRFVR
jgi:hypothetical protein